MQTTYSEKKANPARVDHARRHRASRLLAFMVALTTVTALSALTAGGALANGYTGLLYGGQVWAEASATSYGANSVIAQNSWSAPGGVQFAGFAYTGAMFFADNTDATGGLSAGFKGSGGSAPTDLNFPFTYDCSVTEATPREWVTNQGAVTSSNRGPGGSYNGDCNTSGSTTGWNYDNSEFESPNPAVWPSSDYQTLTLSIWCARDANCANTDAAEYAVTNLSGDFSDTYNQPSGGVSWNGLSGSWVQTNTGNVSLSASANDPAGVCSMQLNLTGPESLSATVGNTNPGVTNPGGIIGNEFEYGTNPCWVGDTDTGSWTLPAGLPSGTFSANLQASNPGNYEAQGFSPSGSPTVAETGSVQIDDQTPSVQLMSPTGTSGWTQGDTATIHVSTGPSGLSALSCTDDGSGIGATLQSTNGDNYVYTVSLNAGTNQISCSGANGDGNEALVGNSGVRTYQQDASVPGISFSDGGYTAGTWTALQQTVQVTATGGPSGISNLNCSLDGDALPDSYGDSETVNAPSGTSQVAFVTVPANGAHSLLCTADNAGTPTIVGFGSYQVDVDSQIPETSFEIGSGYAATSTQADDPNTASGQNWINGQDGTITVGVTGTESTIQSGVQSTVCTINGYASNPVDLSNVPVSGTVAEATPFLATFTANRNNGWIDGQNVVSCQSESLAGLVGADGATQGTSSVEYVDVSDPAWPTTPGNNTIPVTPGQCGISSVIDNGDCAYSDGPSQTAWYSTPETVEITADDTGGAAPITSITCSGAPMPASSWTAAADPQDVSNNGLTVTATITAPGGKIDCSAADSASPADTYELGTYSVSIDPSEPEGFFEAQGYQGAAENIIQLKLNDNPSGIAQVTVEATDENTGITYSGDQLTTNPADGHTAYATLDQNTGTWNLTVNPAVFPGINDQIKFVATATTGAGVTSTITTAEDGSPEILTPGGMGGQPTSIGSAYSLTGDSTLITATARAGKWSAAATSEQQLPTALQGTSSNPVAPTPVGTIASWKHSVCKSAPKHPKKSQSSSKRSCRAVTSRSSSAEALPAKYNQETEIDGTLTDTTTNTPIAGGSIGIYVTNLATDQVKLVHVETAGARGNFSYRLAAGPDRRVDLIYLGQWDVTHGADTAFDTTTAGKLHVHAAKLVRVGQHMRITGRILGGSIDAKGALVQMQYMIPSEKTGWEPFKPGRSNTIGAFMIRYPIARGNAKLTYRVRIKVPTQAGWGFRGTTSNVLRFHVA
jgi:hypothetical protein